MRTPATGLVTFRLSSSIDGDPALEELLSSAPTWSRQATFTRSGALPYFNRFEVARSPFEPDQVGLG